jgi:hypothetical protein
MEQEYAHAFFSVKSAEDRGFSLCEDASKPGDFFRVTHISLGQPPEEWKDIKDIEYMGVIHRAHFGNHYHLPGRDVCLACITQKQNVNQEGQNDPEERKRKIVKAKRTSDLHS